jgi:two-component sensor histidine kinase
VTREADAITLSVRDEGVGLPAGFDPGKSSGLGMRLVSAFAKQLGGALDVKARQPGTEFLVHFPLK